MGNSNKSGSAKSASASSGDRTLDEYKMGKILGEGTFAEVRYAQAKDGSEAAVKILFETDNVKAIQNEIECMKLCNHSNSIRLFGSGVDVKHQGRKISYLILELAKNGELFQILAMTGAFDEDVVRLFANQLYSVIDYFHENGVTHRDLKPENCLLDASCTLKIADFGLATKLPTDGKLVDLVGSPGYIAPEVYEGSYHKENDIWGGCVIHFIMTTGCPPFRRAQDGDWWFGKLKNQKWDKWWKAHKKNSGVDISKDGKDLFQSIFNVDPNKRFTVQQIKDHKWFTGKTIKPENLLERFRGRMSGDISTYEEEEQGISMGQDTNRAIGSKEDGDDDDNPPALPGFVLPRRKADEKVDEDTGGGNEDDGMHRAMGDEGDEGDDTKNEDDAEEYDEQMESYTRFESASMPQELYSAMESICKASEIPFKPNGKYALKGTIRGENNVTFVAQVFSKKGKDTDKRVVEFVRLQGTIRNYMNCYAKVHKGMNDLILKENN